MKIQKTRQCPECGTHLHGKTVNKNNQNLKIFICRPCDEEWYENIRYCIPEHISVS